MDAVSKDQLYTTDYVEALPDGQRAELIDGRLYMMAMPSSTHQQVLLALTRKIADCLDEHGKDCALCIAPYAVYINNDKHNYLEPDLFVVCDKSKITEKGLMGAPDFVVEIVSPSSRQMDYLAKLLKYGNSGVREYWIVDPMTKRTMVYNFEETDTSEVPFSEDIHGGICKDLVVNLSEFA